MLRIETKSRHVQSDIQIRQTTTAKRNPVMTTRIELSETSLGESEPVSLADMRDSMYQAYPIDLCKERNMVLNQIPWSRPQAG